MSSVKEVTPNGWIKYNKDSKITAESIFKVHKSKMGLTDADEIKIVSQEADKTGRMHLKYKQFYKGIAIEGTDYTLHLIKGQLDLSHGRLVEDMDMDTKEKLNEKKALELAIKSIDTKIFAWEKKEWEDKLKELKGDKRATFLPIGEKVITKKNKDVFTKDNFALAWKFPIETAEPKNRYEVYVDANTGEVIRAKDTKMECFADTKPKTNQSSIFEINAKQFSKPQNVNSTLLSPSCWGYTGYFIPLYARYSGGSFGYLPFLTNYRGFLHYDYSLEDCRIHTKPWDFFWWFGVAGNLTDDENTWDGSSSSTYRSVTTAHWAFQKSWDYFYSTFGRWGGDGNGQGVHVWANCENANASYSHDWLWQYDEFKIGTGQDNIQGSYATLDVIGHEFTHAVTHHTAGLNYEKESGALNESFSDIFGTMVERSILENYTWTIAEDCGTIRDMRSNSVYKGAGWWDIDDCNPIGGTNGNDNCRVHSNSRVQNRFFNLLADGGSQPVGPGTVVSGIGIDNSSRIGYRALTNYLQANSNYADAREAWLNAARDLFGECSEQRRQVANAWSAVGIGNPITCTPPNACNFADGDFMFYWYGEYVFAHKCGDKYYCTTDSGTGGYFKPRHWLEATGYANANCFEENDPRPNCSSTGGGGTGNCTFSEGQYIFTFGATGEVVLSYHCGGILYAKTTDNLFKPRHWLIAAGYDATLAECFAETNPGCGANGRVSAVDNSDNRPDIEAFKFETYPNPTSDNIKVKFYLEESGKVKLNLWDSKGVAIINSEFEGIKGENIKMIELNSSPSGVYFIELQNGSKSSTQKIVKTQ